MKLCQHKQTCQSCKGYGCDKCRQLGLMCKIDWIPCQFDGDADRCVDYMIEPRDEEGE